MREAAAAGLGSDFDAGLVVPAPVRAGLEGPRAVAPTLLRASGVLRAVDDSRCSSVSVDSRAALGRGMRLAEALEKEPLLRAGAVLAEPAMRGPVAVARAGAPVALVVRAAGPVALGARLVAEGLRAGGAPGRPAALAGRLAGLVTPERLPLMLEVRELAELGRLPLALVLRAGTVGASSSRREAGFESIATRGSLPDAALVGVGPPVPLLRAEGPGDARAEAPGDARAAAAGDVFLALAMRGSGATGEPSSSASTAAAEEVAGLGLLRPEIPGTDPSGCEPR